MATPGNRRSVALVFYAGLVTVAALVLLQRLATATLLAPGEVIAYGRKLDRLRAATRVQSDESRDRVQVTWTLASRCGDYRALAVLTRWSPTAGAGELETHLAARLDVERGGLPQRDPRRSGRAVLRLQRDDLASDLATSAAPRLALRLALPAPSAGVAPPPVLAIDNLAPPTGAPLAIAADGAFAAVAIAHCKPSAADLRTLGVLARLLRSRACYHLETTTGACVDTAVLLYPDLHAGRYRVDIAPLTGEHGRLRLRLVVEGEGAALRSGTLELLGESDLALAATLAAVSPAVPGAHALATSSAELRWHPQARRLDGPRTLDFAALLAAARQAGQ